MSKFHFSIIIFFCFCNVVFGQNNHLHKNYEEIKFGKYPGLLSGALYPSKDPLLRDEPTLNEKQFQESSLEYEDFHFDRQLIKYDIFMDELVISHQKFQNGIILNSDLISHVELADGTIIVKKYLNPTYKHHRNGFYKLVYSGEYELLSKNRKELQRFSSPSEYYKFFSTYVDYFVLKDEEWILVENPKQLINVLDVDNKEFKKHVRALNLKFKRDKDKYLIELLKFSAITPSTQ